MFKNYVGNCRVFWRSFNNMKFAWKGTYEALMVKFGGEIGTLYQMLKNAFKKHPLQNRTNVQIKGAGGSKAFWTMLKKTALFWKDGIPKGRWQNLFQVHVPSILQRTKIFHLCYAWCLLYVFLQMFKYFCFIINFSRAFLPRNIIPAMSCVLAMCSALCFSRPWRMEFFWFEQSSHIFLIRVLT